MTLPLGRIAAKQHRRVCLIRTEDALLAEELLSRKKLAQEIAGRLTDQVLLIRPGRVAAVLAELEHMGHTPRMIDASGRDTITNTSRLQPSEHGP